MNGFAFMLTVAWGVFALILCPQCEAGPNSASNAAKAEQLDSLPGGAGDDPNSSLSNGAGAPEAQAQDLSLSAFVAIQNGSNSGHERFVGAWVADPSRSAAFKGEGSVMRHAGPGVRWKPSAAHSINHASINQAPTELSWSLPFFSSRGQHFGLGLNSYSGAAGPNSEALGAGVRVDYGFAVTAPAGQTGLGFDVALAPRGSYARSANVQSTKTGAELRLGQMLDGLRANEAIESWYFFTASDNQQINWNLTGGDGFDLRDLSYQEDQVMIGDLQAGFALQRFGGQASISYVRREVSFPGGDANQDFAAFTLTWRR